MAHKLTDKNRTNTKFNKSLVQDLLPEYFQADNPDFITFLEHYYNFLDSDGQHNFDAEIHSLGNAKDIGATHTDYLTQLTGEIGGGLNSIGNFDQPRFALQRLAQFYRTKGSRWSIEEFFRLFFQDQSIEVQYPKKDLFLVGDSASQIGYESLKFIQNYTKYQIFSLLIKGSKSVSQWSDLYKKFVHPAGWYFEGEVIYETATNLNLLDMPIYAQDSAAGIITVSDEASFSASAFPNITYLYDSAAGYNLNARGSLTALIQTYASLTSLEIDKYYHNISTWITPNSFTFDDSHGVFIDSDHGRRGDSAGPDMSLLFETMDNDMFTRYASDSQI